MNSDATEAALGLLGLSPLNASQSQHPHQHVTSSYGPSLTSTSVGVAVDRASAPQIIPSPLPPSLVPLKRKQPSPALSTSTAPPLSPSISREGFSAKPRQTSHPLATSLVPPLSTKPSILPQRYPQQRLFSPTSAPQTPSPSQLSLASPSTSQHPLTLSDAPPPPDSDAISCICGSTYDDGFSIACDDCSRWCHAACFGIVQGGEVPEFWKCWVCDPTVQVDRERAVKIQKGRLKVMRTKASHGTNGGVPGPAAVNGIGGHTAGDEGGSSLGKPISRRKASPGTERKSRRGSAVAAAIEGSGSSRKKRRASILSPVDPSLSILPNHSVQTHPGNSRLSHSSGNGPVTSSTLPPTPVTFPPDIYPNPSIYSQLLRVAKAWRGVTALNPPLPLIHPPPRVYNDSGFARVDAQGYRDRYGYSMSPLDSTTPVILDEDVGDVYVPRTMLRTDLPTSCSSLHSTLPSQYPPPSTCTPAHLRPPSPKLHLASDPSPFSHTPIYPSPPISNHMSPSVPSLSHPRPYAKSPLTPSSPNDTILAATLLAPYTATMVPSAAYLADPLNGYAHLGMGKPQVRLVGGGWGVGLDARSIGGAFDPSDSAEKGTGGDVGKEDVGDGKARWARCGCWPNAVVRPVICNGKRRQKSEKGTRMRHKPECTKAASEGGTNYADGSLHAVNGRFVPPPVSRLQAQQVDESSDQDDTHSASDSDADSTSLSFALFALRDLRADEEIVLGWEWDDGHAVHMLPALMESPGLFAPAHLRHLRAQFTSILHALSSTFTTCACGSSTRDCAVRVMESVVEGRWPWPGGEVIESEDDSSDAGGESGEWDDDVEIDVEGDSHLDPRPQNRGLGMNVDVDIEMDAPIGDGRRMRRVKRRKVRKKGKAEDVDGGQKASDASSTPKPMAKKAINLGPLVGVKRGFRTREKEPMNGGWGGVEIVPSSLRPFPELGVEESANLYDKGKGKARAIGGEGDMGVNPLLSALPPRMRKVWAQSSRPESKEERLRVHSKPAKSRGAHERWRNLPETNSESPISVSGAAGSGRDGAAQPGLLGADEEDGADGQETEFDTETEADALDDTRQMPPPRMPASLDPTTVSSLTHAHPARSLSPRGSIQRDKNGVVAAWIPPRTPTPTSASSGQSSQLLNQGPAISAPISNTVFSSVPLQVNSLTLPPSTSMQAQAHTDSLPSAHSYSLPLTSSVSPSATFSKLSLHSPNASSPSLFSESVSSTFASMHHTSDLRAPSPPFHKPSKPLHVYPQDESLSLSASLPAPVVTLNSPDGTRDTPAEAQYQQPYRSSPESQFEARPSPDVDKKCYADGEGHHVRFASPEILNGFPRLKGKSTPNPEPVGASDEVLADSKTPGLKNQQEVISSVHDAMDITGDVVGDNEKEAITATPYEDVLENRTNQYPDDCFTEIPEPPEFHNTPTPMDGVVSDNHLSPPVSVNGTPSAIEPMSVDPEFAQPTREPSPLPPPKVKMSLKDFALRKKKQREEEMAAKALHSPAMPDRIGLPSSPGVDLQMDLGGDIGAGQAADPGGVVNGHVNGVTEDISESSGDTHDKSHDSAHTQDKDTVEGNKPPAMAQIPPTGTPEVSQSPPRSFDLPRVQGEEHDKDQTQKVDSKPLATLVAKMEILDAMLPSGPVGADHCTPDVVSFAPEPPPPPLTIKQTSEITVVDRAVPTGSISGSITPSDPASSGPTSMSTSTSTSAANSRSNSVSVHASTSNGQQHHNFLASSIVPSRRPSHEDGEITSSTPPKTYLPRSHTPPTQPRSFHAAHPPSPNFGPTSSSTIPRRPVPPLSRSPLSNSAGPASIPISSRPLPSGPRALRGSMTQSSHTAPYSSTRPSYTGSQYIPRGPSADRDRDWDRGDRQWTAQVRPRGRAGSNGWGR